MGWRFDEVWLDTDVLWFREQPQPSGAAAVALRPRRHGSPRRAVRTRPDRARRIPSAAAGGAGRAAAPARDAHGAGGRARARLGDDAADRRAAASRSRAGPRAAARGPAEPHLPGRRVRLPAARARPRPPARAPETEGVRGGVAPRALARPPVRRQPGRRHAASGRGARLGDVEPEHGLVPEPPLQALRERAHDPEGPRRGDRLPRGAPGRAAGRRRATSASATAAGWTSTSRTRTGSTSTSTTRGSTVTCARRSRRARSTTGSRRISSTASSPLERECLRRVLDRTARPERRRRPVPEPREPHARPLPRTAPVTPDE